MMLSESKKSFILLYFWCNIVIMTTIICRTKVIAFTIQTRYYSLETQFYKIQLCRSSSNKSILRSPIKQTLQRLFQHYEQQHYKIQTMFRLNSSSSNNNKVENDISLKTVSPGLHIGSEYEIKKSRFIGYVSNVNKWSDGQLIFDNIKQLHPKARHWCYGYCTIDSERSYDDGEPAGTAGVPILSAIHNENLMNVICIVVRYYGGIQLGTGGLIRSYGTAARQVLREAPITYIIPKSTIIATVRSEYIGCIYDNVNKINDCISDNESYDNDGNLTITLICNINDINKLKNMLIDSTRGNIIIQDNDTIE